MSVYPAVAEKASCRESGCLCRDRVARYPSDTGDAEWDILQPKVAQTMAELSAGAGGRPMLHDLRAMVDAVCYVDKYGIKWRALPMEFPPHEAVYAFFDRWSGRGLAQRLVDQLRGLLGLAAGRAELPTAAVIDSQSVKAADTVAKTSRGYDAGKKINGRTRHPAVDCLGFLLAVLVTPGRPPASIQDRYGAAPCWLGSGKFLHHPPGLGRRWLRRTAGGLGQRKAAPEPSLAIVKRCDDTSGFEVLPRRWVVERTFAWLCATAAWCATTSGCLSTMRPCCCGLPL